MTIYRATNGFRVGAINRRVVRQDHYAHSAAFVEGVSAMGIL
jgi:hypothetical protein